MKTLALPKVFYKFYRLFAEDKEVSEVARLRYVMLKQLEKIKSQLKEETMEAAIKALGVPRSTIYRWLRRLREGGGDIRALEDRSRRPKRVREKRWDTTLRVSVEAIRTMFPGSGKAKIHGILKEMSEDEEKREKLIEMARDLGIERRLIEALSQITSGMVRSESTIGRILDYLKRRNVIKEPFVRKRRYAGRFRPYAERLKCQIPANEPGDVVQVDTMYVNVGEQRYLKQFTAVDRVVRWRCSDIYYSATALNAKKFLEKMQERSPFKIKAIQVDGGSEFAGEFEEACKMAKIKLYVNRPRTPKMNGCVERCHRTMKEEFYQARDYLPLTVHELRKYLELDDYYYNNIRPHASLKNKPPMVYFKERFKQEETTFS